MTSSLFFHDSWRTSAASRCRVVIAKRLESDRKKYYFVAFLYTM